MGPYVHRDLTKKWAVQAGFSADDAELVANADLAVDYKKWTKPWLHFWSCGAGIFGRLLAASAVKRGNIIRLGYAIHALQDVYSHGRVLPFMHRRQMDDWSKAGEEKQDMIEHTTRELLHSYLDTIEVKEEQF